jgi:hypothetical protein
MFVHITFKYASGVIARALQLKATHFLYLESLHTTRKSDNHSPTVHQIHGLFKGRDNNFLVCKM